MTTVSVNMMRYFGRFEKVEADTPGYDFSMKHFACPRSHATIKIEVNSDDLLEVEDITRAAVAADYPGWKFNYLRTA
jgi:hypothetical protein